MLGNDSSFVRWRRAHVSSPTIFHDAPHSEAVHPAPLIAAAVRRESSSESTDSSLALYLEEIGR